MTRSVAPLVRLQMRSFWTRRPCANGVTDEIYAHGRTLRLW